MKLFWTERAWKDLSAIGEYIARDNPAAARRHIDKIVKKVRGVRKFPGLGRVVPELGNEAIREVIEGNYRVVYVFSKEAKSITVLTVFEAHKAPTLD